MKFNRKLSADEFKEYVMIAEHIWGGVPYDVDWAKGTKLYQEAFESFVNTKENKNETNE